MKERIYKGCKREVPAKKFNNLKEMLANCNEEFGNEAVYKFRNPETKEHYTMKYSELFDDVNALGTALISIGLKDKRIGVIGENRYEWQEAYLSVKCGTGVVVQLDKA